MCDEEVMWNDACGAAGPVRECRHGRRLDFCLSVRNVLQDTLGQSANAPSSTDTSVCFEFLQKCRDLPRASRALHCSRSWAFLC